MIIHATYLKISISSLQDFKASNTGIKQNPLDLSNTQLLHDKYHDYDYDWIMDNGDQREPESFLFLM